MFGATNIIRGFNGDVSLITSIAASYLHKTVVRKQSSQKSSDMYIIFYLLIMNPSYMYIALYIAKHDQSSFNKFQVLSALGSNLNFFGSNLNGSQS